MKTPLKSLRSVSRRAKNCLLRIIQPCVQELVSMMNFSRGLAILGFLLMAPLSGAWAQLPLPQQLSHTTAAVFSIEGIKLSALCSATCNNEELVAVSGTRGVISFEIVGFTGAFQNVANPTNLSAALSLASPTATSASLGVDITVSDVSSSRVVTGWAMTVDGTDNTTSKFATATGNASMTSVATATALSQALTVKTASEQILTTPTPPAVAAVTASTAPFTFNETMSLANPSAVTTTTATFNIFSQLITFHAVPEPVSVSIMLLGLTGLGVARRSRRKARQAAI
jgi:hypothetical protein